MSFAEKQDEIFLSFETWLKNHGGSFDALNMRYDDTSDERGVFLLKEVKASSTILTVPLGCLLTSALARRNTKVARELWDKKTKFREPDLIALVIHILATRNDEKHFFKPFFDTLPKDVSHFPIFWEEEQLSWLEGSTALGILKDRKEGLKSDYDQLCAAIPDFMAKITFQDFLEVRTHVGSRNFYFKEAKVIAMVPYADMLNHSFPSETEWNFNPKKKVFTMKVLNGMKKDSEVFSTYGAKPNLHYFLYYGFALKDNRAEIPFFKKVVPMDKVMNLKLGFDQDDPLLKEKEELLSRVNLKLMRAKKRLRIKRQSIIALMGQDLDEAALEQEIKGELGEVNTHFKDYSLAMHFLPKRKGDPVKEVLNFFRIKHANAEEVKEAIAKNPAHDPDDEKFLDPNLFISAENEADALQGLAAMCKQQLKKYPNSYKKNLELLKQKEIEEDKLHKLALIVVTGEQSIYNFWRAIAQTLCPILKQFGGGDMLFNALRLLPRETDFERDLQDVAEEIANGVHK